MTAAPAFASARLRLGGALAFAMLLLAGLLACAAAANYPALTGRIVDDARIIPAATQVDIEGKLADLETKSGIQLVVATVPSLQGEEIEPYANGLFRAWQLGQKAKNNGVLLLVAPNERRVRIEVGYGLEGTLTDAISKLIITNAITPRFKEGKFGEGISRGVDDIITVLTTDSSEWQQKPQVREDLELNDQVSWLLIGGLVLLVILLIVSPTFRAIFFNILLNILMNSGRGGSSSSSGGWSSDSGGGFSGGGGSSGGGGASGSW